MENDECSMFFIKIGSWVFVLYDLNENFNFPFHLRSDNDTAEVERTCCKTL